MSCDVSIALVNGNYLVCYFNTSAGFRHCRLVYRVERDRRQDEADSWWIDYPVTSKYSSQQLYSAFKRSTTG